MAKRYPANCKQTGTWDTSAPTPHVDLGSAVASYRTLATAQGDGHIADGDTVDVFVYRIDTVWALYEGVSYDHSNSRLDFSGASLYDNLGTLSHGDMVMVEIDVGQTALEALVTNPLNADLDVTGYSLVTTGNENITLDPGGTGYVTVSSLMSLNNKAIYDCIALYGRSSDDKIIISGDYNGVGTTALEFLGGLVTIGESNPGILQVNTNDFVVTQTGNVTLSSLTAGGYVTAGAGTGLLGVQTGELVPTGTEGQMLYNNAGTWTSFDELYWDDVNKKLLIGTADTNANNPSISGDITGDWSRLYFISGTTNRDLSVIFQPSGTAEKVLFQLNNDSTTSRGRLLIIVDGAAAGVCTDYVSTGTQITSLAIGESSLAGGTKGALDTITFEFDESSVLTLEDDKITAHKEIDVNGAITARELSSDPANPDEGAHVIWQSDGTGSGDDGDLMIKITAGGSTKTATLIDFSAV